MVNPAKMQEQLCLHEGVKLRFYLDTEGNKTWGVGFNVTARGQSELERILERPLNEIGECRRSEVMRVLALDIERVQKAVMLYFPPFADLNEVRQRVVVDLAFNMGFNALGFKKCIAAITKKTWSTAAVELHKAHWAKQVEPSVDLNADAVAIHNEPIRGRADRLAKMLLTGEDYVA